METKRHAAVARLRFGVLVAVAVMALLVGVAATPATPAARAATPAAWTIAVYVNADNNLEPYWDSTNLPQLESLPASSAVNVVAMVDRLSTSGTQLVKLGGGQERVVANYPEKDFGDGATFAWFLSTVHRLYPATHLAVIAWDHGYGWRYFSYDETSGDRITMPELQAALQTAKVPVAILGFDACNMADIEVAYQVSLTGLVHLMVASEQTVAGSGYPYNTMFAPVVSNPSRTPAQVANDMVQAYGDYYAAQSYTNGTANTATLSATDITTLATYTADIQAWSRRLHTDLPTYRKVYLHDLNQTYIAWESDHYDLGNFAGILASDPAVTDSTLKALTQRVVSDIKASVLSERNGTKAAACTGLTLWFGQHLDWTTWQDAYAAEVAYGQPAAMDWWAFLNDLNAK